MNILYIQEKFCGVRRVKNILLVSGTYIAALIGAGLASGAETVSFFARYGKWGGLGVAVCSFVFGFFIYIMMSGLWRTNTQNLNDYISRTMSPSVKNICEVCILLFMVCVYSAMIAGAGEFIENIFGIKKVFAMLVFNLICIFIVMLPIGKIMELCGVLGLAIGAVIIIFSVRFAYERGIHTFNIIDNWVVSSTSYSGYNLLSCVGILCPLVSFLNDKSDALKASVISGVGIFLILICMWGAISIYYGKISLGTFPMLTLASRQGSVWYAVYSAIFFLAILTTAISTAYGIYTFICKITPKAVSAIGVYLFSAAVSILGFGTIVGTVYKVCGIIGILLPIIIVKNELKLPINREKRLKLKNIKENKI